MEDKKTKMKVVDKEPTQKLTYEQLNEVAMKLSQENQYLQKALQQASSTAMFKRLDYLFMVLENADKFDAEFVKACADEIKEAIIIAPEEEKQAN